MFWLESPAGVGYSICDKDKAENECAFDDNNSAADNMDAVRALLQKEYFEDIKNNELYIMGESYAGIYIPKLVKRLDKFIEDNKDDESIYKPNLVGFAVGNGVTDWRYDATPASLE